MPACQLGDALMADRPETLLLLPEVEPLPSSSQMVRHTQAPTGFKIRLPLRVVRIGLAFDLWMPTHWHTGGTEQTHIVPRAFGFESLTKEHPVVPIFRPKVLVCDPPTGLLGVAPSCPLPQQGKDLVIDVGKGPFACAVLMILRSSADIRVELQNQMTSRRLLVMLHQVAHLLQKSVHVLFGQRTQQPSGYCWSTRFWGHDPAKDA